MMRRIGSKLVRLTGLFTHGRSAGVVVFALFGLVNVCDVVAGFGDQPEDLSPFLLGLHHVWVAVRNFASYTFLPVAIVFLFGRLARGLLAAVYCFAVFVEIGSVYARTVFKADLGDEWLSLLLNTTGPEARQFVCMTLTPLTGLVLLGVIVFLVWACRLIWSGDYPKRCRRSLCIGVLALMPYVVLNGLAMNWHRGLVQMAYSHFIYATVKSWTDWRGVRNACMRPQLPKWVKTTVPRNRLPDLVIVVGESSTRNDWHLYGYPRDTTPRLDAYCRPGNGGYRFRDVVGLEPVTDRALAFLLTDVSFDCPAVGNWTMAEVLRRAGYRCVLLTRQWNGVSTANALYRLFNGCERRLCVPERDAQGARVFDEALIPMLQKELAAGEGPQAVFVHMAGMHFPVREAIPESERHFDDSVEPLCLGGLSSEVRDRVNRYDDAIRYEDKVLGGMIDALQSVGRSSCLVFVSDHGESPRADGWRVYDDRSVYELPVVVWLSESYRNAFPDTERKLVAALNRPMQSDELTYGILALGQVVDISGVDGVANFLSPAFKGRNPRYINKGRLVYQPIGQRSEP